LRTIFKSKTRDEWLKILKTQEIPVAPVNELHETFMDPQIQFRQMRIQSDGLCYLRFPVHFSNEAIGFPGPAPKLGQHTDELLKQLGYGQPEIDSLRGKGVI
jgi:crotonobetainyl-CoA:carnitine CoA-transferase CaiB-like acyl-CoA transferase